MKIGNAVLIKNVRPLKRFAYTVFALFILASTTGVAMHLAWWFMPENMLMLALATIAAFCGTVSILVKAAPD